MTDVMRSPVETAWARIGKVPGEREDYRILAASRGPIDVRLYCEEFPTGFPSPATDPNASWTPPWATFGVHRDPSGMPLISIAIQLWWEGRDQAARPIWPRNFFALKYADTAAYRLSYRALYEAVNPVELPAQASQSSHTQQYRLNVEQASPSRLVVAVNRFGFEWLAGAASALLDGPVAIGDTADLRLDDRLDLIDAIAALLPYGFRAGLSASSGVSVTSAPRMRLILTEDAFDNHRTVYLGYPPRTELTSLAAEYLRTLLQKAGAAGLERVIAHQLQGMSAYSFGHPEAALAWLSQLDRRSDLISRLAIGKVDLKDTVEFANEPAEVLAAHWETLPLLRRHQLVGLLTDSQNEAASRSLARLWGIAFPEIVQSAVERLDQGQTDRAAQSLQIAESSLGLDEADKLLAYLLIRDEGYGRGGLVESWRDRMDACVSLLLQRPVPPVGTFTTTLMALPLGRATDWQAVLVRTLLSRELARDPDLGGARLREWLSWFHESARRQANTRPRWAAALDLVTGASSGATRITREVTTESPAWAGPLIRFAATSGQLPEVLGDLGTHVIWLAIRERADAGRAAAGQQASQEGLAFTLAGPFRSAGVPPETLAIVDAARVILEIGMIDCPEPQSETFGKYRGDKGLGEAFAALADQPEWTATVEAAFLAHVVRVPVSGEDPLPPAVVKLIAEWCADQNRAPGLARHIDRSEGGALVGLLLHFDQLSPDQWRSLARYLPRFRALTSAAQLRKAVNQIITDPETELARETTGAVSDLGQDGLEGDLRTWRGGVSNSSLATAMYNARLDGMEIPQILAVLHGAQVRSSSGQPMRLTERTEPSQIWDVLREFQSQLHHRPLTGQQRILSREQARAEAASDLRRCLDLIMIDGVLGADYARRFRDFYLRQEKRRAQIYRDELKRYRRGPRRATRHTMSPGPAYAPGGGAAVPAGADGREATVPRPDQWQFRQQGPAGASSGDEYPGHVQPPYPVQNGLSPAASGEMADEPPQSPEPAQPEREWPRAWWRRIVLTGNVDAPPSDQQEQR